MRWNAVHFSPSSLRRTHCILLVGLILILSLVGVGTSDIDVTKNDHIRLVDLIDPELRERADVLVQERLAGREAEDALQQGVANAAANAGAEPELQATPENAESACVPGGCGERGTCNEFTGECDCIVGWIGETCDRLAIPSCQAPDGTLHFYGVPKKTCSCLRDWIRYMREHVPILEAKLAGDSCFEDSGEPLEVVLNSPERYAQKNLWNSCRRCGDGVREELAAPFRQQDNTPLSACKENCNWRGSCFQERDKPPKCRCELGQSQTTEACTDLILCLNDCRGKGRCVRGVCVCDQGYWGMDCSSTRDSSGRPAVLDLGGPELLAEPAEAPSFFVYDLPVHMTAYQTAIYGDKQDFARRDGFSWLAHFYRSRHRTADPERADFFVVPVWGGIAVDRVDAIRFVRSRWPYFDRAAEANRANHILMPMFQDSGMMIYEGMHEMFSEAREGPIAANETWADALPPEARGAVFLTAFGLQFGQSRIQATNFGPQNRTDWWRPREGFLKDWFHTAGGASTGGFVPGKDVVVPYASPWFGKGGREACRYDPDRPTQTRLYFEGSTVHYDQQNPRKKIISLFHNLSGYVLRDASKEKKLDPDRSGGRRGAEFCLAPGGQAGGFGLRELEALAHNCVPLYVNDNVTRFYDEALSFPEFEVELPEDEIPDIPAALERAAPRVREMRRRAFCACHAVAPSFEPANSKAYWGAWRDGDLRDRTDKYGSFATFLAVLRVRLERWRAEDAAAANGAPPPDIPPFVPKFGHWEAEPVKGYRPSTGVDPCTLPSAALALETLARRPPPPAA